jgi:hypothetical protein
MRLGGLSSKFRIRIGLSSCTLPYVIIQYSQNRVAFLRFIPCDLKTYFHKMHLDWNSNQIIRSRTISSGMRDTHAGDAPHEHVILLPLPEFTLRLRD